MIDLQNSSFVLLLAGVAFFLYGMTIASQALEKIMASRISSFMQKLSENNFLAIVVGISLTTLLQSSGAVISMLVGLGSARVITLPQVMGVIMGSAIGSTITVQIISLDLSQYALPLFFFSFLIYFASKKTSLKNIGLVGIGFALLFLGQKMITISAHSFVQNEHLKDVFVELRSNPIYSLLASMIFCLLVQSSAITISLAMSLVSAGAINMDDAILWVYGANVGTTSIAIIAAASSNYIGKQVAWAHFFYKVISVLLFYPFTAFFITMLNSYGTTVEREVANAHFFFNIISAAVLFPFIKKGAAMIQKLFPKSSQDEFGAEFLNMNNYESSALAVSFAHREILRTADIVESMLKDSLKLFYNTDAALIQSIKDRDNQVDFLYRETKMFLLDHANKSPSVSPNIMYMIMFLSDLERAADAIDINILALAIKKNALKLEFSDEGWNEIKNLHSEVVKVASMGINAFQNKEMCENAIQLKRELAKLEINLRENHIERLNKGLRDSINTSSIHLDLLSEYRRIASLLCHHAYSTTKQRPSG